MCVLIHSLQKKFVKENELKTAMKNNSSGFFMAAIHKESKTMETIRTLKEQELLDFFNNNTEEDDEIVFHARIPSYGEVNIDNVHGWEDHNIVFAHNGSLSVGFCMNTLPSWKGKTDSEFFFRKVFIPLYLGLGTDAYKDGKLNEELLALINWFCDYSKMVFIMPDNKVIRIGHWITEPDKMLDDKPAFFASNTSYKEYKSLLPSSLSNCPVSIGGVDDPFEDYPQEVIDESPYGTFPRFYGKPKKVKPPKPKTNVLVEFGKVKDKLRDRLLEVLPLASELGADKDLVKVLSPKIVKGLRIINSVIYTVLSKDKDFEFALLSNIFTTKLLNRNTEFLEAVRLATESMGNELCNFCRDIRFPNGEIISLEKFLLDNKFLGVKKELIEKLLKALYKEEVK